MIIIYSLGCDKHCLDLIVVMPALLASMLLLLLLLLHFVPIYFVCTFLRSGPRSGPAGRLPARQPVSGGKTSLE
jgi:hypothetical protein